MTQPLLAIDTSGARLQLGLSTASGVLSVIEARERGHAEILFDRIAALLARGGVSYAELERIAVITGPGSFSGLRIGLSAARGLGLALDIPVLGVPRLLALSLDADKPGPVGVLVDARRGEAWYECFPAAGQKGTGTQLLPAPEARARLAACATRLDADFVSIDKLARFAETLDPDTFLPVPAYIREADAKPQQGARVARLGAAS